MITLVRLAGAVILLFAEAVFPDANMIVLIAFVWIGLALVVDTQRKKHEYTLVCKVLNHVKNVVSKPVDR